MGLRLGLSISVLIVPAFLMGGTLPAAGRVAETETDSSRRKIALAFGAYTLGAVVGVVISTFYLLEHFGNRMTLWLACGLNLLVSLVAFAVFLASHPVPASDEKISDDETSRAPVAIVLLAATHRRFRFSAHGIGLVSYVGAAAWRIDIYLRPNSRALAPWHWIG